MNKEVEKAMKRKKENRFAKWWHANDYRVWRVLLFFIWIPMRISDKLDAPEVEQGTGRQNSFLLCPAPSRVGCFRQKLLLL